LDKTRIFVGGDRLYILLNKPAGYLVTSADPQGRPTVFALLGKLKNRVFAVGRLDQDTEGVLLFTDDGELAHGLAHPKHGKVKEYRAEVSGTVDQEKLQKLIEGVQLEDGIARARSAKLLSRGSHHSEIYLKLITGKKRQVRRMCAAIGHPVIRLRRTSFAGLSAQGLQSGQWRYLTRAEVRKLKSAVK
jgi:23S rRNA pseudouridine2605 synthase